MRQWVPYGDPPYLHAALLATQPESALHGLTRAKQLAVLGGVNEGHQALCQTRDGLTAVHHVGRPHEKPHGASYPRSSRHSKDTLKGHIYHPI